MEIYFPVAGVSVNLFTILGLGGGIGLLSGIIGVGGGFLLTPLLIQIGIPAPVAAASAINQVTGASVSGYMVHRQRGTVDLKMGLILLAGGLAGSTAGVGVFKLLRAFGQIDLTISLLYVFILGAIGSLMLIDGLRLIFNRRKGTPSKLQRGGHRHTWIHRMPIQLRFPKSRLYISALVPAGVGFGVGLLSSIMGVGGGFMMVPAMIYLIGMPTAVVVGTSLFQIMVVSANVTFLHAVTNQTVDVLLAVLLLAGGTVGAQIGTRLGAKLRAEHLRVLLAVIILMVSLKVLWDLTIPPTDIYSIGITMAELTGSESA